MPPRRPWPGCVQSGDRYPIRALRGGTLRRLIDSRAALVAAILILATAGPAASQQPTPRDYSRPEGIAQSVRSRTFDVEHYTVDVLFDEARRSVMGKVTIRLKPFASGFRQFTLDAVDMRIASVTVDGRPQQFRSSRSALDVLLDREYPALQ